MASTRLFQPAERRSRWDRQPLRGAATGGERVPGHEAESSWARIKRASVPGHGWRASRRAETLRTDLNNRGELEASGFPEWKGLQPVLLFLLFPALFAFAIAITGGQWEPVVLYSLAGLMGLYVFWSALRGAELVIACTLLYLPFSGDYVIPVAPGVNGTNMLLLLGLFAALLRAADRRQGAVGWPIGSSLVIAFGVLSILSGFTVLQQPGGWSYLIHGEILNYKAWIDQFLFYAILASTIRDVDTAKRVMVYMAIGAIVLALYTIPEILDKWGRSTIEKSRLEGPHQQSNNFGGFVGYTLMPLVAWFMVNIRYLRAWLLLPYFLLAAKILISTFSRGAYLAVALSGMVAGLLKGKGFVALWTALFLCFFLIFPRFIPDAIMVRLQSITEAAPNTYGKAELDKSSGNRLVLWGAAIDMMKEDPLTGKGFKAFQKLKAEYTETPVRESDPHSMYMYIGSQMGIPALLLYLALLGWTCWVGRELGRHGQDRFVRAIGIGGTSATVCFAVICLFGSRAVNLEFTAYWWAMLVVLQVLYQHQRAAAKATKVAKTGRAGRAAKVGKADKKADGTGTGTRRRRTAQDIAREALQGATVPRDARDATASPAAEVPARVSYRDAGTTAGRRHRRGAVPPPPPRRAA